MANKSLWRTTVGRFVKRLNEVEFFLMRLEGQRPPPPQPGPPEDLLPLRDRYRCYEYATIWLHQVVESFLLEAVVYEVNRKPSLVSAAWGVPLRVTDINRATAEFLLTRDGYFDLGRRLDEQLGRVLPSGHHLRVVLKRHARALKRLSVLRNLSAHDSGHARRAAFKLLRSEGYRGGRIGWWLRQRVVNRQGVQARRLVTLEAELADLFNDIQIPMHQAEEKWRQAQSRKKAIRAAIRKHARDSATSPSS
jgi:hypothetical protein